MLFYHVPSYSPNRDICPSIWISSCSYWKFSCPHFQSILFVLLPPLLYFASVFFLHAVEFHHIPVVYFWEENWQFLSILILCSLFLAFFLNFIWNLHTQATSPLFWHPKCRKPGHLQRYLNAKALLTSLLSCNQTYMSADHPYCL